MSADGYIADESGGIAWLERFGAIDFGFSAFLATIDTVVMGRATYDQVIGFGGDYPYAGKRSLVVTSSPLPPDPPAGAEAWHDGIASLAAMLRRTPGKAWIVGGARLQSAFIADGLLERLRLFVLPILLGSGIRLHHADHPPRDLVLAQVEQFPGGAIMLDYRMQP